MILRLVKVRSGLGLQGYLGWLGLGLGLRLCIISVKVHAKVGKRVCGYLGADNCG